MANNEEIILNVADGSPYVVGARAYVEQTDSGAIITIEDKYGTTTAEVDNGVGIASATLNEDYTLTLLFTDGTSTTTNPIRGEKGDTGYPTDEQVTDAVDVWLGEHPEATTTVQDGAITKPKLDASLQGTVDLVGTNAEAIDVLGARMDSFTHLTEGSTTGDAELIDGRVGADGVTYPNIGDAIRGQVSDLKSEISGIVNTHQNYLEITGFYDGEYWKRSNPLDRSSSSTYKAFYGIDVEANKTYYYKHIFLYYSVVVYEGTTTVVTLTNDTAQDKSGSFTPSANGKIYLTYNKTLATPLFTDDENLYNAGSVGTYYTPNKLKLSEQPMDTDDLIMSVGYTDGYYIDGSGNPSSNALFRISEFMPVESDTVYDIAFTGQMMVGTYQSDKSFIARQILNSGETLTISKIHIPSTAKYVRLSWAITTQPYTKFAKRIDGAEFHVGANYPYLKLSDAVNDAILSLDSVVRIHDGTYDLYTELGGSDYFDSYTYASNGEGLVLKNRVHLIGSSASLITFNYTGSNAQVKQYFSVFNAGAEGFTLENVNIECSNCRYAIHDERYTNIDLYINKYLNCNMEIDNSANTYGYRQCIGGGLGTNGEIIIKDCYFKTIGDSVAECVSYHNSSSSNAKSRIIASGNYCDNGTMRFSWHGTSTKITEVIASNNSVPSAITTRAEQVSDTTENVKLKEWNNEIRS